MAKSSIGSLIIIGGHEDKEDDQEILKKVKERVNGGKLVIATAATRLPEEVAAEYVEVFTKLGVKQIDVLDIRNRQDAYKQENIEKLNDASMIYFTGGDQLRITAHMGGSPVYKRMLEIYLSGGAIVGTSAGASVMSETMMVRGSQDESHTLGDLAMAPGFGLLKGVIVDQHFAQRGRIGRLIGAVSQNPRNLGIGIDENTAIVVENGATVTVIGEGAIYVVDGSYISDTNLADGSNEEVLSCFDIQLHVLKAGQMFDLDKRRPFKQEGQLVMPVHLPHEDDHDLEKYRPELVSDGNGQM